MGTTLGRSAIVVLGFRALYLSILYWALSAATPRHTVESAWIMFVGAGAIVRWLRGGDDDIARDRPSTSLWTLAAFCAVAVILYWEQAAAQRDRIERAAKDDPRFAACDPVALQDLPDNVSGVHLFRNGVTEAFARDVGLHAVVGRAAPACTFRWTGDGFAVSGSTLGVDTPGTSRSLAVRLDQIPRPR